MFRPAAATVLPAGLPSGSMAVCSASTTAWSLDGAVGWDPPEPDPPTADRGADTGGVESSCMLPADAGALPVITGTGDWLTGQPALTGPPATGQRQHSEPLHLEQCSRTGLTSMQIVPVADRGHRCSYGRMEGQQTSMTNGGCNAGRNLATTRKMPKRCEACAPDSADTVWLLAGPSLEGCPERELLLRAIISAACHASPRRMRSSWFAFQSCRCEVGVRQEHKRYAGHTLSCKAH